MKKCFVLNLLIATLVLSACAKLNAPNKTSTAPAPSNQSNAERAENFSNAVQYCVGKGYNVGSPIYDACVKNQLK